MRISTKYITINKNIDKTRNDLIKITRKPGKHYYKNWWKNGYRIFFGCISNNNFEFHCLKSGKLDTPVLYGELMEKNIDETILKIDIHASKFHIVINIIWIIIILSMVLKDIIWGSNKAVFMILFIFLLPVMDYSYYFYNLKEMLNDLNLYKNGYYDEHIKKWNEEEEL
jgi:hypothetical protein